MWGEFHHTARKGSQQAAEDVPLAAPEAGECSPAYSPCTDSLAHSDPRTAVPNDVYQRDTSKRTHSTASVEGRNQYSSFLKYDVQTFAGTNAPGGSEPRPSEFGRTSAPVCP